MLDGIATSELDEDVPAGFPSAQQLDAWHKAFPSSEIRGYPFPGLYVVFRSYTMSEHEELITARVAKEQAVGRQLQENEIEQMMMERFVLWPANFKDRLAKKDLPAGIPSVIASYIMVSSGFIDLQPEVL